MHKFIYSLTMTDGIVEHAGFSAIEEGDLPLVPGTIAGDYTNPSLHVDQYGRITSIVSGVPGITIGDTINSGRADGSVLYEDVAGKLAISPVSKAFFYDHAGTLGSLATKRTLYVGDETSDLFSGSLAIWNHENTLWLPITVDTATGFMQLSLSGEQVLVPGGLQVREGILLVDAADTGGLFIQAGAAQVQNLLLIEDSGSSTNLRVGSNGYLYVKKTSAPANASIATNEVSIWLTNTAGTPVVNFKGKDSAGTVFTHTLGTLDQIQAPAANVSLNSHKITNLTDPTAAQDAATKAYVDTAVAALDEHEEVKYATAAALTELSYTNNGGVGDLLTLVAGVVLIDGQAMTVADRVLIKNQAAPAHNGIWTVTTVGALGISAVFTRATDFDQEGDGIAGAMVFVLNGTANEDTRWQCSASGVITWGTTALNWSQFLGSTYSADETTLHLTGTTFSIKSTYVGQSSITTLGTITTGVWNGTRVTLANIAVAGANSVLVGSGASGSGATYSEVTLGTGLTMTGTVLSATSSSSGGGPDPITSAYPLFTVGANDDEFDDGSFAGFTAVNSGSHNPTITESNNIVSLSHPGGDAAAELHAYMKTVTPSTNDYIEIAWRGMGRTQNFNICGLIFADGTTYGAGTQVVFYWSPQELNWSRVPFTNYNTAAAGASFTGQTAAPHNDMFLRFKYEGSNNWSGYASPDGVSWFNVTGTFARTLSPTAIGFFVTTWGGANPFIFTLRYFKKAA